MCVQIVKVPEARMLMVSLAATATAEGVRSSLLAVRDMLLGNNTDSGAAAAEKAAVNGVRHMWQLPTRELYVLICIIFSVLLYFRSRLDGGFSS